MAEGVENIGPEGQRKRLMGGLVAAAIGVAGATGLILSGASRWWRVLIFPFFWQGALGFFQFQAKT
jgi:hypothetical protein